MIRAIQNGLLGMERATGVVNSASSDIARSPAVQEPKPPSPVGADIARDMVDIAVGHKTYDANARVVEVAARMLDAIL